MDCLNPWSKGYNKLFTSLIANGVLDETLLKQRLLNTEDGVTSTPNDSALLQGFKQSKLTNLQSKGVIYLIESKIRPVDSAVSLLSFNQYSLEHLLPFPFLLVAQEPSRIDALRG